MGGQFSCWKVRRASITTENVSHHVLWEKQPSEAVPPPTYILTDVEDPPIGQRSRGSFADLKAKNKEGVNCAEHESSLFEPLFAQSIKLASSTYKNPAAEERPLRYRLSKVPLSFALSYSRSSFRGSDSEAVRIDFDECEIEKLVALVSTPSLCDPAPTKKKSISMTLSLTRISQKNVKKVRFNDKVIIHTIEYSTPKAFPGSSEAYVLIITLREIWSQLDLDKDGHLNTAELKGFCSEVWEDVNIDIPRIMDAYAKIDRIKGMRFHEWCCLVKDEDPDLDGFVDDLYDIFVEPFRSQDIVSPSV